MSREAAEGMETVLVDERDALEQAVAHVARKAALAVDLEGEYNLHRYGVHLCLVQICDGRTVYLVDAMTLGSVAPLAAVLEDPKIPKVMCAADEDVKLLKRTQGIAIRGLFDVQLAAHLLGQGRPSLGRLVERYLGVRIEKKESLQRSDWSRRPLTREQCEYAAEDVRHLLAIWERQKAELAAAGLLALAAERNRALEAREFRPDPNAFLRLRGAGGLDEVGRRRLAALYAVRERIAESLDLPPYRVMRNEALVAAARRPPGGEKAWAGLLEPPARRFAPELQQAVAELDPGGGE